MIIRNNKMAFSPSCTISCLNVARDGTGHNGRSTSGVLLVRSLKALRNFNDSWRLGRHPRDRKYVLVIPIRESAIPDDTSDTLRPLSRQTLLVS
ncbi:hypothetical protein NPIL_131771 [Nephila pilipes]|uniref:Uncharacterized protein n=1 Tax=Nephila pilipes TaxID=299642 RepID=A0A8X6PM31_NEPPI|nr:hypothetical protein NPIL_131771 [Nephila pilipes]